MEKLSFDTEIGQEIKAYHSHRLALINQQHTSQMIRRSPTASESRIYVLPQRCENFLVFQLGENSYVSEDE